MNRARSLSRLVTVLVVATSVSAVCSVITAGLALVSHLDEANAEVQR